MAAHRSLLSGQYGAVHRPTFIDDGDQNVDSHPLHCSICCDVSFDPVVTPCNHIFCRICMESGLQSSLTCPNCRRPLQRNQLRGISDLHQYIYERTLVQCSKCGVWKGSLKQYKDHVSSCTRSPYIQELERKLQDLQICVTTKQEMIEKLQVLLRRANDTAGTSQVQEAQMKAKISSLEDTVAAQDTRLANMGPIFDGLYRYDESNVCDLSRIISRNLFNKPGAINPNHIFNCIKKCYDATSFDDGGRLKIDVRMLLATSYSSNWFSNNQDNRFLEWYNRINGNTYSEY